MTVKTLFTVYNRMWCLGAIFQLFSVVCAIGQPLHGIGDTIPFQPYFHHLGTDEGLPSNAVYNMHQDQRGHLWLCTDNGVARFNGQEIERFELADQIGSNGVVHVAEASNGNIWFGTYRSEVFFYSPRLDTFIYPGFNSELRGFHNSPWINNMLVTDSSLVLFGRAGMILKLDISGKLDSFKGHTTKYESYTSKVYFQGWQNQAVIVQNNRYLPSVLDSFKRYFPRFEVFRSTVNVALAVEDGLLFGASDHLCWLGENGMPKGVLKLNHPIISIQAYNREEGTVWVGCHSGGATKIVIKDQMSAVETILDGKSITSLLYDDEGGLWVSTGQDGLFFRSNSGLFELNSPEQGRSYLRSSEVHPCLGKLYFGGNEGQVFKMLSSSPPAIEKISQIDKMVTILAGVGQEYVFAYTSGIDGCSINCEEEVKEVARVFPGIYEDHEKGQLRVLRSNSTRLLGFEHPQMDNYEVLSDGWDLGHVKRVITVTDTFCYIIAHGGLAYFNSVNREFGRVKFVENSDLGIQITDFDRLNGDTFLVATNGYGLFCLVENRVVATLNKGNLLGSNRCQAVAIKDSLLWVGSDLGVQEIVFKQGAFFSGRQFRRESGFPISHVNWLECHNGGLIIGTESSVFWLNLEKTTSMSSEPIIQLASFHLDGKGIPPSVAGQYELPHRVGTLEIAFEQRGFKNLFKRLYRYRVIGLNDQWTLNHTGTMLLHRPPPGSYQLEVSGMDGNGHWSTPVEVATFLIPKPFNETLGFKWSIGLIMLVLVLLAFYLQRLRIIRNTKFALSLSGAKNKALSAQLNPHFLYNVLNTVGGAIVKGKQDQSLEIITRFSKLVRQVFDNSHHDLVTLEKEVSAIQSYATLEKDRMGGQLDFQLIIHSDDLRNYLIPPLLIQPLVENAIWHGVSASGSNGRVVLEIMGKHDALVIKIKNTGEAFLSAPQSGLSLTGDTSLSVIVERLALLKKLYGHVVDLNYDTGGEGWTTIATLHFPKISKKE